MRLLLGLFLLACVMQLSWCDAGVAQTCENDLNAAIDKLTKIHLSEVVQNAELGVIVEDFLKIKACFALKQSSGRSGATIFKEEVSRPHFLDQPKASSTPAFGRIPLKASGGVDSVEFASLVPAEKNGLLVLNSASETKSNSPHLIKLR